MDTNSQLDLLSKGLTCITFWELYHYIWLTPNTGILICCILVPYWFHRGRAIYWGEQRPHTLFILYKQQPIDHCFFQFMIDLRRISMYYKNGGWFIHIAF